MKKTALALTLAGLLGLASVSHAQDKRDYIKNYVKQNSPVVQKTEKKSFWKNLEFEIGGVAEQYSQNPISEHYTKLNQDFKYGKYTFATPLPQWKDIQVPSFNTIGGEAAIKYKLNNKTKLGVTLGANSGKSTSNYNEDYDIYDSLNNVTVPSNFERTETANISNQSIGIKLERDLSKKFSVSLAGKSSSCKIDGNLDYTFNDNSVDFVRGSPWPYTQKRIASFNGNGTINSVEAGIDYNITKNLSIGINAGSQSGKIKTIGEQVRTQNTNTEVTVYDYSPEFDFNSTYGKVAAKLKF